MGFYIDINNKLLYNIFNNAVCLAVAKRGAENEIKEVIGLKRRIRLFSSDKTIIFEKIKEAFSSVLPITLIMLVLCFFITPVDSGMFLSFIVGAFLLIVGMGIFTLGADIGMTPIGEYVGSTVVKSKKIWIIMPVYFVVGVLITIAEPDLHVLANILNGTVDFWVLIWAVGIGLGVFLVIAVLRIIVKLKLSYLLLLCYVAVFVLSMFVPSAFVPLAFDSGGVTTGPMSVPFIIALGTGIVSIRSDKKAEEDGFGLTALCSIGPIIAVMILGVIFKPTEILSPEYPSNNVAKSSELFTLFISNFPTYMEEVGIALLPIVALFLLTMIFGAKIGKAELIRIFVGVIYTYIGLVLFLTGVNVGFLPVGAFIGSALGSLPHAWIIVPIGMVIGFFIVAAEPAVHVLTNQVYEVTSGSVPKKALSLSLMIGVAVSVGLAMLRILLNIPILYFLIPGYGIALILTFFVPDMFTAIAFDAGGVASGAMTSSFVLPLAIGACSAMGGNIALEGFGVVAMVAMTPLITIQLLGLIFRVKTKAVSEVQETESQEEIILE